MKLYYAIMFLLMALVAGLAPGISAPYAIFLVASCYFITKHNEEK